jgi:Mor family transcriptional regulator
METKGQKPEFYLDIMIAVVEVLCRHKMAKPAAVTIGFEITEYFTKNFGGMQFYISKNVVAETARKAAMLYAEFDGSNYLELALKYDFTEQWVRQLVKRGKKAVANKSG